MDTPEAVYKYYPVFTINDQKFQYYIQKYDSKPLLIYVGDETYGCGNPWNYVEDLGITDEVKKMMPPRNLPVNLPEKPVITIDYHTFDDFLEFVRNTIESDCWLVYSTNDNREPQTVYYNMLTGNINEADEYEKRIKLINNTGLLLDDLKLGNTVHVILNKFFIDHTYKKVPDQDIIVRSTVEYWR